jgi:hypothetical protein
VSKREEAFMHNHGGRLYGTNTTGQQLWVELHFPDGLKPSVAIPNLIRRTKKSSALQNNVWEKNYK